MKAKLIRSKVFVSYSHADRAWLDRLRIHLKPLVREGTVEIFEDGLIKPGQRWKEEIEAALSEALVAVLLVSADFLASDFVANDELPPLLEAAEEDGVVVLPVILAPSRFSRTPSLSQFQAVNNPKKPLQLLDEGARETVWDDLADHIEEILERPRQVAGANPEEALDLDNSHRVESCAVRTVGDSSSARNWCDFYPQQSAFTEDAWQTILSGATSRFDTMGTTLSGWRRTREFRQSVIEKARSGCAVRILLMHEENPALDTIVYGYEDEQPRADLSVAIRSNYSYFQRLSDQAENIQVRRIRNGNAQLFITCADQEAVIIQYLYSASWGHGALWHCGSDWPLYSVAQKEFDYLWQANEGSG